MSHFIMTEADNKSEEEEKKNSKANIQDVQRLFACNIWTSSSVSGCQSVDNFMLY